MYEMTPMGVFFTAIFPLEINEHALCQQPQLGRKCVGKESRELIAEQVGQSRNQISRYIRLTELIPEILEMVDNRKIALNPAVSISYLETAENSV